MELVEQPQIVNDFSLVGIDKKPLTKIPCKGNGL